MLDIGCRDAFLTQRVSKKIQASFTIGIDPEIKHLIHTKKKTNSILAVGETIPVRTNSFDKIICLNTLDHVEAPSLVVDEMLRVLKPSGEIIITIPCLKEPVIFKKTLQRVTKKMWKIHTPYSKKTINNWFKGKSVTFRIDQYPGAFSALPTIIWNILFDFRTQKGIRLKIEHIILPLFSFFNYFAHPNATSRFGLNYRVHVYKNN